MHRMGTGKEFFEAEVYSQVVGDGKKATIAKIKVMYWDSTRKRYDFITSSGTALRNPIDKFDGAIATEIALGRALSAAGKALIRQGWGRCKHQDNVRARRKCLPSPTKSK